MRSLSLLTMMFALLGVTATAAAQSPERPTGESDVGSTTEGGGRMEPRREKAWDPSWPRFRWWEYVGTGVLAAEAFMVRVALQPDEDPNWQEGILADDWALETLRLEDQGAYDAWILAGDIPYYGAMGWAALDPVLSGAATGDWDAAGQMALMNLEAFAVLASVLWTTQHFVRRERPQADLCSDPRLAEQRDVDCGEPDLNRSFLGGHTGVVTTTAALTCLHHTQMDLYGEAGDALACGTWIAAAGVTFASRTVTAKHYLSDNVLGAGLGLLAGWLVPFVLHYGQDEMSADEDADDPPPSIEGPRLTGASVSPSPDGLRLNVLGTL